MTLTELELVTLITTIGALGVAIVPVFITSRKKANDIQNRIGEPNGHGSLSNITEEILGLVKDLGHRMNRMESRLDRLEETIDESR